MFYFYSFELNVRELQQFKTCKYQNNAHLFAVETCLTCVETEAGSQSSER